VITADGRGETREEQTARLERAPGALQHRSKVSVVAGKVEDGVANDDISEEIGMHADSSKVMLTQSVA